MIESLLSTPYLCCSNGVIIKIKGRPPRVCDCLKLEQQVLANWLKGVEPDEMMIMDGELKINRKN